MIYFENQLVILICLKQYFPILLSFVIILYEQTVKATYLKESSPYKKFGHLALTIILSDISLDIVLTTPGLHLSTFNKYNSLAYITFTNFVQLFA